LDIIELAIQGIKKFNSALRFTIKDGYNVFFGPSECGKTTLFETILAILDKKFCDEKARTFIPWDAVGAPSRAGLIFKVGADTLRIVKDFSNSSTTLSRAIGEGKYEPLSREPDWIHDHLINTLGLPAGDILKDLLLSSSLEYERFKSYAEPAVATLEESSLTGSDELLQEDNNGYELSEKIYYASGNYDEEEAIKKRIEQLQEELLLVEQITQIQFQVDGLQSQVFEIETKLKEIKVIDEKIASIDMELDKLKAIENMPDGIDLKIKSLKEQEEAKNKELFTLQKELQNAKQELNKHTGNPFYKEKTFIAGISTAIPFLIAQFVLTIITENPLIDTITKFFPIIWLSGWGLLGYTAWNELSRRDKEKKARKRLNDAQERIKTVEKKYEVEALLLKNLLQQARLSSSEDLLDGLEKIKMLKEEKKQLEEEKKALRAKYNLDGLLNQKKELENTIKENEKRLLEAGGFSNDPNEIRKEIERLTATLSPQKRKEAIAEKKEQTQKKTAVKAPAPSHASSELPLLHVLNLTAESMKKSSAELFGLAEETLNKNLSQLSGGIYTGLRLREDKDIFSVTKDGKELQWHELSPSSKETIYFGLKFSMLEKFIEFNPLPIILDEPFVFSDEMRIIEFARLLRKLSEKTKVIHFTSKPIFAKAGNQVYNLKGV
jgi:energy-coupling factor transporter ATP-binding protein EcfA2